MSKDCLNCPAFGKHCPHKVNGDPYFYDCYLTVAELEKENAELKEKLKPENCLKLLAKKGYVKFTSEQFTKAKELLKKLLVHSKRYIWIADDNNKPIMQKEIAEAEQFLKDN